MRKFVFLLLFLLLCSRAQALAPWVMEGHDKSEPGPEVCTDADIPNYVRHKFRGEVLGLDDSYARYFLHLVAPEHPMNAAVRERGLHVDGRCISLVIRIPEEVVLASPVYRALISELEADEGLMRKMYIVPPDRIHLTISQLTDDLDLDALAQSGRIDGIRDCALRTGPFRMQVRGPWVSGWSEGRVYLLAYPEIADEDKGKSPESGRHNVLGLLQDELRGGDSTHYGMGFICMKAALTKEETARLKALCDRYLDADGPLFDFTVDKWQIFSASDSLLTPAAVDTPEITVPLTDPLAPQRAA